MQYSKQSFKHIGNNELFGVASKEIGISAYYLLKSALIVCNDQFYENHLEAAFDDLMETGRVNQRYREYIINVLTGDAIVIIDNAENGKAFLLA